MVHDTKSVNNLIIPHLDEVMLMIEKNIFRPLPNFKRQNLAFSETGIEQEEEVEPSWPYLVGIYDIFLQLIIREDIQVKTLKIYITPQFV